MMKGRGKIELTRRVVGSEVADQQQEVEVGEQTTGSGGYPITVTWPQ